MKTRALALFAVVIGAIVLGSNSVAATPAVGFTAKVLSKGTLARPAEVDALGIGFSTEKATDVYVQQVDIAPGGKSGWHEHPGLVLVSVATGSVIVRVGCDAGHQYSAGQTFTEPPLTPILVANASATAPAQNFATLVVPAGRAPRIELPGPPDCSDGESDQQQ